MTSSSNSDNSTLPSPEPRDLTAGRRRSHAIPDTELLQAVLDRAQITQWDILIIGDGSGTGWLDACGYAGVMIDRETRGRKLFKGAKDPASVNVAEISPYTDALGWYHAQHGKARLRRCGHLNVHVLTDSQVVANWGNQAANPALPLPSNNSIYLAGLREAVQLGYRLYFHWGRRSDNLLNWTADLIAGLARRELIRGFVNYGTEGRLSERAMNAIQRVEFVDPTGVEINIYDLNPDEEPHGTVRDNPADPPGQP